MNAPIAARKGTRDVRGSEIGGAQFCEWGEEERTQTIEWK